MKLRQRVLVGVLAGLMVTASVSTVAAQRVQPVRGGRPGGGFGVGVAGFETMLLRRADVRKELELLDEQVEKMEGLRDEIDMRSMFQEARDAPQEERREKMQQAMEQMRKKMKTRVGEILLPHQLSRLNELAIQFSMRGAGGLLGGEMAEKLDISEAQREQLVDKLRELRREMEKKLREELIEELKPEQQAKLKGLMGEPFTFEETERQFRRPENAPRRRLQAGERGNRPTGGRRAPRGRN